MMPVFNAYLAENVMNLYHPSHMDYVTAYIYTNLRVK